MIKDSRQEDIRFKLSGNGRKIASEASQASAGVVCRKIGSGKIATPLQPIVGGFCSGEILRVSETSGFDGKEVRL